MSMLPRLPELQLVAVDPQVSGMEGARMSYMQAGAGPETVLLLHGIGSNCCGWRYMFEALSDRYRVVAWNAPGYYLSDNFASTDPTNWQYADALLALMDALGTKQAIYCPAFPENGRTIFRGHLFVADTLLSESGMEHHPLTPMTDANLVRVLQPQSKNKVGLVRQESVSKGAAEIQRAAINPIRRQYAKIAKSNSAVLVF